MAVFELGTSKLVSVLLHFVESWRAHYVLYITFNFCDSKMYGVILHFQQAGLSYVSCYCCSSKLIYGYTAECDCTLIKLFS